MKCPNDIKVLGVVNVPQTNEQTETKQAKALAYNKFLNLISDYRQIDCVLMVSLDEDEWQRRLSIETQEEEKIQNAWWQD